MQIKLRALLIVWTSNSQKRDTHVKGEIRRAEVEWKYKTISESLWLLNN